MTTELDAAAAAAPPATAAPEAAPVEPAGTANADLVGETPHDPSKAIPHAVPQAQVHHATDPQVHHNQHPNTPPVSPPPPEAKDDSPLKTISRVQPSHADPVPQKKVYAWQKRKAARKA